MTLTADRPRRADRRMPAVPGSGARGPRRRRGGRDRGRLPGRTGRSPARARSGPGSSSIVERQGAGRPRRRRSSPASGPGEFFGELSVLDGGPRVAQVDRRGPTRCLAIASWDFERVLREEPGVALAVLRVVAAPAPRGHRGPPDLRSSGRRPTVARPCRPRVRSRSCSRTSRGRRASSTPSARPPGARSSSATAALIRAALAAHGGVRGSAPKATRSSRRSRIRSRAVATVVDTQRALAAEPWPDGTRRSGCGWGSTGAWGSSTPTAATSAATSIGRHASPRPATAARSCCPRPPPTSSTGRLPDGVRLRPLGAHRLKDLQPERIDQLVVAGLHEDFPPIRSLDARPNNLPVELTPFVGRERELDELRALLETTAAVTLTGPGGTGKSRLALQLAAAVADRFPDGTWFVPLAAVSDAALVPRRDRRDDRHRRGPGPRPRGRHRVRARRAQRALLVLDNLEQLARRRRPTSPSSCAGCRSSASSRRAARRSASTASRSTRCPGSRPRWTSTGSRRSSASGCRRAPRQTPRRSWRSSPSACSSPAPAPSARGSAVTDANAGDVAAIVAHLGGVPLAIELAAARLRFLTPAAIHERLEGRLDITGAGAADVPERQRSLRGAIAWSYDLLEAPERRLFERLSVFIGGFDLVRAEAVAGAAAGDGPDQGDGATAAVDVLDALASLVDHSLVAERRGGRGAPVLVARADPGVRAGTARCVRRTPRRSGNVTPARTSRWRKRWRRSSPATASGPRSTTSSASMRTCARRSTGATAGATRRSRSGSRSPSGGCGRSAATCARRGPASRR